MIEASELLECFLWHDNLDAEDFANDKKLVDNVEEELADVVIYCLGMTSTLDVDLEEAVERKLAANEQRFDETPSFEQRLTRSPRHRWNRRMAGEAT
ncbi:MazG-like family protein [Halobacterium sp. KA-6]|uniref:MazG-like family protein n=1 Tax=Halobacterium sp. KA-6 TaxID=2896368 RepID=UPI001E43A253|nr:MazG-like family protein [Halobacterium sp. KA-6]MCD2204515.1 hypothetical protein [Halobacterium sp. KA-6]